MNGKLRSATPAPGVTPFEDNPSGPIHLRDHNLHFESAGVNLEQDEDLKLVYDEQFRFFISSSIIGPFTEHLDYAHVNVGLSTHKPTALSCLIASRNVASHQSTRSKLLPSPQPFSIGTATSADSITGVISNGPELLIPRTTIGDSVRERPIQLANDSWEICIFCFSHTNDVFRSSNKGLNSGRFIATHWFSAKPIGGIVVSDEALEELIDFLTDFLSYVRGAGVGVLHVCGYKEGQINFVVSAVYAP